ncbi:hypothetical protein [Isobaculum melis]|uniref:Uncharacterized protein n=1 Tax=Isobaculum melis TaxID=142588 RepID=A0A1H9U3K4_9LACT|nr:hypothetical protein [Isobaculum melis]SES04085.1 hypothetical protein SAMN04488559_12119 [Isobaculum melis]
MKNSIAGLGLSTKFSHLRFKNIDLLEFKSYNSLLEFDIVLIDLDCILLEYDTENNPYKGKKVLTIDSSFEFLSDYARIKNEIDYLLDIGKTIYVTPPVDRIFYIHTGDKQYSGTGRNQKITNVVQEFDILDIVPISLDTTISFGDKVTPSTDSVYKALFEVKGMDYCYNAYFESSDTGIPLAYVTNTKKIVSQAFSVSKGHIVLLPSVLDSEHYLTEKKFREVVNSFLHVIDDLEEEIKSPLSDFSLPEWANKYNILDEKEKKKKIEEIDLEIEKLMSTREKINNSLIGIQKYKLVFTSTGKELESIVCELLLDLRFESESVEHNRADGIFKYGDTKVVVEIKGVNGSSAEKHGAQLEKWVAEFIEKEGITPKPLLIVNGFRNKDLSVRNDDVFPNQMVNYSVKREHCLISTLQLLGIYSEIKNNPSSKDTIINELLNTIGIYDKFNDYRTFL